VMKRSFAFIFLLFTFYFLLPAQQVWYFGFGAGLKFNSSGVQPIYDGKIFTNEGCAVANDSTNHLLFYTDGITVWNFKHEMIENGNGLNGNHSSTQSALIVQKPGEKNLFYVFTVDEKAGEKGLCYSVIDMKKNNNKGAVILKNQKLIAGATEKLTAVLHQNGKDVWVIAQKLNPNLFYSYPVTSAGIGNPVLSPVSIGIGGEDVRQAIGYLRASSDGKKIASAVCYRTNNNLNIFDFDNRTGKISNDGSLFLDGFPYGLCFSPDNSKLYISFLSGKSGVLQYDLISKNSVEIMNDEKENSFGSLQPGPDGKIYAARTGNYLDVISEPDKTGKECNYKKNAVDLSPANSSYGLPNNWSIFSAKKNCESILEKNTLSKNKNFYPGISTCEAELMIDAKNQGAQYKWSTGETNQKIKIDTSGIYRVQITKSNCSVKDSIKIIFKKDLSEFRYLPVFNPEDEFINTEFYYSIEEIDGFELKVSDKKNNILFQTQNTEQKWNGKNAKGEIVSAGEYLWEVKYTPRCPAKSSQVIKRGTVTVKRNKK